MMNDPFIQTYTGKKFSFTNRSESICIRDIAHALSNICRFNGHCVKFYSVAEHSLHVMDKVHADHGFDKIITRDEKLFHFSIMFYALLHDAAEAYIGDITAPLKKHIFFTKEVGTRAQIPIVRLEISILIDIYKALAPKNIKEFSPEISDFIHNADLSVLAAERKQVMTDSFEWVSLNGIEESKSTFVQFYEHARARRAFEDNLKDIIKEIEEL